MIKKHTFGLLYISFLMLVLAACGGGGTGPTAAANPTTDSQTITIPIGDFYVHAPTTTFQANVHYHFVVKNEGKHHHDFLIMHPMSTETIVMDDVYKQSLSYIYNIAPGETKTLDFVFNHTAPKGMLEFSCHYGGHWEAGMHQAIVVDSTQGTTITPYPNNGVPPNANVPASASDASGTCDPAISVNIGASGAYDKKSVAIKKGDTLTIINSTPQSFTLTTKPDAGIRFTTVDPNETEHVPFPNAGTFTLASQEHPEDTVSVQVATTAGTTCGFTSVKTISFDANYTNPQHQYFFIPTTVTLKEGQSITLSNLADNNLTFASTPDADLGDITLDRNENQLLQFTDEGTYTISCKEFPTEKFTVIVQDSDDN